MKHTVISYTLPLLAAISLLSGCITPYNPKTGHYPSLLVVEGIIVDGETTIRLSRSADIYPEEDEEYYYSIGDAAYITGVAGAQVWIEGENGARFDAIEMPGGWDFGGSLPTEYIATGVSLEDDVRYRLCISSNGQEYQSDFRFPQSTPPIDNIDFSTENSGAYSVDVTFDVTGEPDQSRYYLWSYEETWEFHAQVLASHYFVGPEPNANYSYQDYLNFSNDDNANNDLTIQAYPNEISPYYYCWNNYKSKEILLANTDLLAENKLIDHLLYTIDRSSTRLQSLYHTRVYLYSIGEDAYRYFSNQKKFTDETDDIFAPIPSEMRGNIVNLTTPDVPVIGFVDVSRRTDHEVFLGPNSYYDIPASECFTVSDQNMEEVTYPFEWLYLVSNDPMFDTSIYAPSTCIDCRVLGGGKNRPSWWPNDHY